ncbi:MAG: UvrD-helicase domain-containing protein [bacterium]|nr:UvrD-helicase domain-containing protein [bacterium]
MKNIQYIVLLNETLKQEVLTLPKKEKARLRAKFEFLENGIWDSGVKVKKLKGMAGKVVFEARLDKGDRILFTLGKHNNKTAIYIWGITRHDDISKNARVIIPENAPFLNFEPSKTETYEEVIFEDLPQETYSQEGIEDKTTDRSGPQKWLVLGEEEWERIHLYDSGTEGQELSEVDDFELALYLTADQEHLLENDPPLLLSGTAGSGKTTISVYYLLKDKYRNKPRIFLTYNEFLKRFSEGLYKGLVNKTGMEAEDNPPRFHVFKDLLLTIVREGGKPFDIRKEAGLKRFTQIFSNNTLSSKYDSELVWEEIRSIIKGGKPPLSIGTYKKLLTGYEANNLSEAAIGELQEYIMGLSRFEFFDKVEKPVKNKTGCRSLAELVHSMEERTTLYSPGVKFILAEILKILHKKSASVSSPLLTYNEYVALGKKRAPNFLYDRKEIYSIAEYYQGRLESEGLWDELDLTKAAIAILDANPERYRYNLVVCDEIQDFTDIQVYLIFRLARTYRDILCAGDPRQIINPSGFRWEEVKDKFYERGAPVPDLVNLRLNFRSVGNIIKLSNSLLDLKQKLIGLTGNELKEEWKFSGKPPVFISGIEEQDILEKLSVRVAGLIILVRDAREQKILKERLRTELVFTISEAKGLEFDTVLVWKFINNKKSRDLWRKIGTGQVPDKTRYPHIKHEINLFYVAVTRARNTLILYDGGTASDLCGLDPVREHIYFSTESAVLDEVIYRRSTPGEWDSQGDYFFERQYYRAAMESYVNAGNSEGEERALAYFREEQGDYAEAAELFEKLDIKERAARCYEYMENFQRALELWQQTNNKEQILYCQIKLYEQEGDYNRAADAWVKLEKIENAVQNWEKAKNYEQLARYYASQKEYEKAAHNYALSGDPVEAAHCYKKIKNSEKAAAFYYKGNEFGEALELYTILKNRKKIISCYRELKDFYSLALLYEKEKDYAQAMEAFGLAAEPGGAVREQLLSEAREFEQKGSSEAIKAALRYSALGEEERAGDLLFEKEEYELALDLFKQAGSIEKKAECYNKLSDYYMYACTLEETDLKSLDESGLQNFMEETARAFDLHVSQGPGYNRQRAELLNREAVTLYEEGEYAKALPRYKAVNSPQGVLESYLELEIDDDAIPFFIEDKRDMRSLKSYLANREVLSVSREMLVQYSGGAVDAHEEKVLKWYRRNGIRIMTDMISLLFMKLLKQYEGEKKADLLELCRIMTARTTRRLTWGTGDTAPNFISLLLSLEDYNSIMRLIKLIHKKVPEEHSELDELEDLNNLDEVEELYELYDVDELYESCDPEEIIADLSEEIKKYENLENDINLQACYCYINDNAKYEEFLDRVPINEKNVVLFTACSRYKEGAELLAELGKFKDAALVYHEHEEYALAAKYAAEGKDWKLAGLSYESLNDPDSAARFFEAGEYFYRAASLYEKIENYEKALELWKELQEENRVKRVQKKMEEESS